MPSFRQPMKTCTPRSRGAPTAPVLICARRCELGRLVGLSADPETGLSVRAAASARSMLKIDPVNKEIQSYASRQDQPRNDSGRQRGFPVAGEECFERCGQQPDL